MRKITDNRPTLPHRWNRRRWIPAIGIILCLLILLASLTGCVGNSGPREEGGGVLWRDIVLTDVSTGTDFSLSSFGDIPVLVQTFTITCPVCMRQQDEITRLHESGKVPFVMVGLDIDPNGNPASLRSYTDRQGYYGLYARSPPELTRLLAERFGITVLSPAQAPLILICPDGNATLLPSGIKTVDDLEKALSGC